MIIVTGGTGFIGSAIVWGLNERGIEDVLVVDKVADEAQMRNLKPLSYSEVISGEEFREKLSSGYFDDKEVEGIIHLGAISSTLVQDWDKFQDANVDFSKEIIEWCVKHNVRCVYASSGATYGDGSHGYDDSHEGFDILEPLNPYGKSKLIVDMWARDEGYLDSVVGLRYFNVFGPNEYHKGDMRSVVAKKFPDASEGKSIKLFKSYDKEYEDGGQMRDFVYVKDVVDVTLFFLENPEIGGVFNVGTGIARSWNDVARALFSAVDKKENIEYIDMPVELQSQYQNFTQADISKLRSVGYDTEMTTLEDAISDYVLHYLVGNTYLGG